MELETEITNDFGVDILDKFNAKVRQICAKLEQSLIGRGLKKFDKLASSHMENLYLDAAVCSDTEEPQPIDGQVGSFIENIGRQVDRAQQFSPVIVEDLGAEESLSGINPLPVDSPMLLMDVLEENISGGGNEQWSRGLGSSMSLTFEGTVNRSLHTIQADPHGLSVDDMALLLVDLMGDQSSGEVFVNLPSREPSTQLFSPSDSTEGNITEESRIVIESPTIAHIGMGTCNDRVFHDGLQVVVNLSRRDLTPAENSLLSKGLSFCPTPKEIDIFALKTDMLDFVKRLRLKECFCGDGDVGGDFSQKPAFRKKSSWCPSRNRDLILETYVDMLERKIFSHDLRVPCHRNISRAEQEALETLRGSDDIVIKQADKGSAVVVMDREKYIDEAMRQLNDRDVYIPLQKDPMIKKINVRLNTLHDDGYISDSTLQYLLINSDARAGRFYLLPKIHETNCPGRPVISGCNTPTEENICICGSSAKTFGSSDFLIREGYQ